MQKADGYFQAFLFFSREKMPQLRAKNGNMTPDRARTQLLTIWRSLSYNEKEWYVWQASKARRGQRSTNVTSGLEVIGTRAPTTEREATDSPGSRASCYSSASTKSETQSKTSQKLLNDVPDQDLRHDFRHKNSGTTFKREPTYPNPKFTSTKQKSQLGATRINLSDFANYWSGNPTDGSVCSKSPLIEASTVDRAKITADYRAKHESPREMEKVLTPPQSPSVTPAPPNSAGSSASTERQYIMRVAGKALSPSPSPSPRQSEGDSETSSRSESWSILSSVNSSSKAALLHRQKWNSYQAKKHHVSQESRKQASEAMRKLGVPPTVVLRYTHAESSERSGILSSTRYHFQSPSKESPKPSSSFTGRKNLDWKPHTSTAHPEFGDLQNRSNNCNNVEILSPILTPRQQRLIQSLAPLRASYDIVSSVKKTLSKSVLIRDWMSRCQYERGPGFNSDGEQSFVSAGTASDENTSLNAELDLNGSSIDVHGFLLNCSFSSSDASVEGLGQRGVKMADLQGSLSDIELARTRDLSSKGLSSCSVSRISGSIGNEINVSKLRSTETSASVSRSDTGVCELNRGFHEDGLSSTRARLLDYKNFFCGSNDSPVSSCVSASNSSVNSNADQSILSKALKIAGIKLSHQNDSFRLAMENPLENLDDSGDAGKDCLQDLFLGDQDDGELALLSAASIAEASRSSLSLLSDFTNDLDHSFLKTSTPIKQQQANPFSTMRPTRGPLFGMESQEGIFSSRTNAKQDTEIPATESNTHDSSASIEPPACSENHSENSSEDYELVEIEFDTSSSTDEESNDESGPQKSGSGSLSAANADCGELEDSLCESDSCLNNLNFTTMMQIPRTGRYIRFLPPLRRKNLNTTWHPGMTAPLSPLRNYFGPDPKQFQMKRSTARTNLLDQFNFYEPSPVLAALEQPPPAGVKEKRVQGKFRLKKTRRSKRYSEDPDCRQESQFWAPKDYIDETEKAVYYLLKTEFSSSTDSL